MKPPFREGDTIVVTPDRLGKRGEAEATHEGWRVRVRGGLPGEAARVVVVHVSRGGPVAEARFRAPAAAPHPGRRAPPCPIHDKCGGCGLQHWDEDAVLEQKIAQARALLPGDWEAPLRSPRAFGYRAKTFLLPQRRRGRVIYGARPPRGAYLIDTSGCGVLRPELEALAARVRDAGADAPDTLRAVLLRAARGGAVQATFVHGGPYPWAPDVGADGLFVQRHDRPGNAIHSDELETLVDGEAIAETFAGLAAVVPPTAFVQANPDVAEALYAKAAEALDGERLLELYCGAGVAGLLAARARPGARLHGVDRSPRAAAAAQANAAANGLADRCTFEAADAAAVSGAWDAVLVNPPRAGCHADVLDAIARSGARRLVYLSCSPATLARDAERLGWRLDRVVPADMLPQTPHLELLAVFTRP